MYEYSEINYYKGDLILQEVLSSLSESLQDSDEALNVCDLSSIVGKYCLWRKCMPRVSPYYAVKCNNVTPVLKTLAQLGINFDCASKNEIEQVLNIGVSPERIIFAQPCKPISHLEYAKAHNVSTMTADNEFEIYKILKYYPQANIVVRFRCEAKEALYPLGEKFGCDPQCDAAALVMLAKSLQLNVIGVSCHVGSGCNDNSAFARAITWAKGIFEFGDLLDCNMNLLDIGGGFPGNDDKKFRTIANITNKSLQEHFPGDRVKIISEPGQFFVTTAYTLICKIHAKREVRTCGRLDTAMYYINDGVYGSFISILTDHQKVKVLNFAENEGDNVPKFKSLIWGPTCDAMDKIAEDIYLPNLNCGDFLAFPNMGAYTVPFVGTFNGFMPPRTIYFMKIPM